MSKTKFFIFCQGRSGSNLLVNLLKSHPDVHCDYELFNQNLLKSKPLWKRHVIYKLPIPFLLYRRVRNPKPIVGFKLLCYQYRANQRRLKSLFSGDWKIIHLHRNDVFQQVISGFVARETGIWLKTARVKQPDIKFALNPQEVITAIADKLEIRDYEARLMEKVDHVRVVYEEDLLDSDRWQPAMERVFDYLGTNYVPVQSITERISARPYSTLIENYDELLQALASTPTDWDKSILKQHLNP
jgi:LPS sulfotransferase NodH